MATTSNNGNQKSGDVSPITDLLALGAACTGYATLIRANSKVELAPVTLAGEEVRLTTSTLPLVIGEYAADLIAAKMNGEDAKNVLGAVFAIADYVAAKGAADAVRSREAAEKREIRANVVDGAIRSRGAEVFSRLRK